MSNTITKKSKFYYSDIIFGKVYFDDNNYQYMVFESYDALKNYLDYKFYNFDISKIEISITDYIKEDIDNEQK